MEAAAGPLHRLRASRPEAPSEAPARARAAPGFPNVNAGVTGGGRSGGSVGRAVGAGAAPTARKRWSTRRRRRPTSCSWSTARAACARPFGGSTRWQALRTALLDPMNGLIYQLQASAGSAWCSTTARSTCCSRCTVTAARAIAECALPYTAIKADGHVPAADRRADRRSTTPPRSTRAFPMTELGGSTPTDRAMNHAVDSADRHAERRSRRRAAPAVHHPRDRRPAQRHLRRRRRRRRHARSSRA